MRMASPSEFHWLRCLAGSSLAEAGTLRSKGAGAITECSVALCQTHKTTIRQSSAAIVPASPATKRWNINPLSFAPSHVTSPDLSERGPSRGLSTSSPRYVVGPPMDAPCIHAATAMGQPAFGLSMRRACAHTVRQPGQASVRVAPPMP